MNDLFQLNIKSFIISMIFFILILIFIFYLKETQIIQ